MCHGRKRLVWDYKKGFYALYTMVNAQVFISCLRKTNQLTIHIWDLQYFETGNFKVKILKLMFIACYYDPDFQIL